MKNNLKKMGWGVFMLLAICSCKKELPSSVRAPLSKKSVDLASRLAVIKEQFYEQDLDAKFAPKNEKGITWTPDWNSPRLQTVNDSVSYVFFKMTGQVKIDGKLVAAQEAGAATYLMVKNEKEFYKAFYYLPADRRSQIREKDSPDAIMEHFTGKLLLSSLQNGRNYLLDYVNGKVSEAYQKNQTALKKLQSVGGAVSYYETQCRVEMVACTYYTYFPTCGGQIVIEYSWNCSPPSYCQNSIWILSDSNTQDVCEQVWFPDPPTDPGSGVGGGGGGDSEAQPKAITEIKVDTNARPCVKTITAGLLDNADDIKSVLTEVMAMAGVNASATITRLNELNNYSIKISETTINDKIITDAFGQQTAIERTNGKTDPITGDIVINKLMLDEGTDLAVASTLIHEMMHAYFVYGTKYATGSEQFFFASMNEFLFNSSGAPLPAGAQPNAQHIQMASTYVDSMAALLAKYAMSRGILKSPDSSISLLDYCKDLFWRNLITSQAYIAAPNKNRAITNGDREFKNQSGTNKKGC